jgi:Flp pilus assembly protein TadG
MMRALFRKLARLTTETRGAAAVEFALVAPFLGALVVGVAQYGGMVIAYEQMHDAVETGAMYIERGGSTMATAQDISLGAWANKPTDAAVTATHYCTCAGVTSTCSSLCPDSTYPLAYTQIVASGTYTGLYANQSMSTTHVVRTQ